MAETARQLVRRIAGFGLEGWRTPDEETFESGALSDATWAALADELRAERLTGLAVRSVEDGWLPLTDGQTERLLDLHRGAMAWCLSLERKVLELAEAFEHAGIPYAVLKGASVAHTMYPDPALRSFADVDLLAGTADYMRACELLGRLGHVRQRPEPRPGFEVRFGKGSVHVHPDDRVEVDLHRTLALGAFGLWIDPQELLDRAVTFPLGGRAVQRLDDTGLLVNVAMHAALGWAEPRLVPLRDVLQGGAILEIDWPALERWIAAWRLRAVMRHAVDAATELGSVPQQIEPLRALAPSSRELRTLQAYVGETRSAGGTALSTLRGLDGSRSRLSYLVAIVAPRREFLAARAGGKPSYARRLAMPVRWVRDRARMSTWRALVLVHWTPRSSPPAPASLHTPNGPGADGHMRERT